MSLLGGKNDKGSGIDAAGFAGTSQMKQPNAISERSPAAFIPDLTYSGIERTFLKSALSRWIFSSLPMQQI